MKHLLPIAVTALASCAFAAEASTAAPNSADWLVNPSTYKAQIKKEGKNLVLDNGIARRVIRLAPNAATISMKNLVSGEELVRATGPEARITVDGVEYPIGGLEGQPIQNYLKPEWVDALAPIDDAYRFADWREEPVVERFKWKKRPEWMARDAAWPPPGKHVVLRFTPPATRKGATEGPLLREEIFGDFKEPDKAWKVTATKAHANASFTNEGKSGEILAPAKSCVFAECAWPDGARTVEVEVDTGDDKQSGAWGPGLALMASDGSMVHFTADPEKQKFNAPVAEGVVGAFDRAKPIRLRARITDNAVLLYSAQDKAPYSLVVSVPLTGRKIVALRVGKVGTKSDAKDFNKPGELVRSRIQKVAFYGAKPAETAPAATGDKTLANLPEVEVHYELYDGIPLVSKWLKVKPRGAVRLDRFTAEELKIAETRSVGGTSVPNNDRMWVQTDYAFNGSMRAASSEHGVNWNTDPTYTTQTYGVGNRCLLQCQPARGPSQDLKPGADFESFRVFELLFDGDGDERRSLTQRRMYRTVAPWTNENPLMFHSTKKATDPRLVRSAIDEAAEVGFEMVIMSFGSGFEFENHDRKYWDIYKEVADYGRTKGIAIGGYSMLASRSKAKPKDNTQGMPTMFGLMPCLGTEYGRDYLDNIADFAHYAGFGVFENDGSYPGDCCASKEHPFHHGLEDSQWVMWKAITKQYQQLRADGVYLNVPDWYFLSGSNKCAMGYRETNWSLPRAEQEMIERLNMYDGTWDKTQSMGWMFVPLVEYMGGGAAATIEPLHEHLPHYETRLANLLGYGVQACYRGPQLFDTPETKAVVQKWVKFYKAHREALDFGDIIHLRRPNGRDWDGILHANPQGKEKGLAMFYNPTEVDIEPEIKVPLHYTGLAGKAQVSVEGGKAVAIPIDDTETLTLKVKIPARGRTWVVFTSK